MEERTQDSPTELAPAVATPRRPRWMRGPLVYYLLAAFDVLTVSASLYLTHRIMRIYVGSVESNQKWAQRMADYSSLGRLAEEVNAPGNDVFNTRQVPQESARMERALAGFQARVTALRNDLLGNVSSAEAAPLLGGMDEIQRAMDEMVAEARLIFAHFDSGHSGQAGERMATMDRRYAGLLTAQRDLIVQVAAIQGRIFEEQTSAARALQRFEYVIAGSILVMVAGATLYGRRLSWQAARDSTERAAHIRELQVVGESLRRAHAQLETRVEERTAALRDSEMALRRAAEEWQRTFEAIDSAVMVLDRDGRAVRFNRTACELSGQRDSEITGRPLSAMGNDEPWLCATKVARLSLETRSSTSQQGRDARSGRTWEVSANFVPDDEGQDVERVIVVARDITRLVELQESVWRDERMSAMGSLVAGVAHEVRNPLFGISSTLDAFEARHGELEPFNKYLKVLRREADRLSSLMRDLLDYGKPPGLDVTEVESESVVDEAIRLCEPLAMTAGIRVVRSGGSGAERVPMDWSRMVQVLRNVIENAIHHSPRGSAVILTGGSQRDGTHSRAWCAVRDSGPGFKAADLPHIFEPFFTRRSGGTGMGLSIAQRIVSQHGGSIEAANHPEGGAVVTVYLPARDPA